MTEREEYERYGHLTRLGWDLHARGIAVSLVMPVAGDPVLEMLGKNGTELLIAAEVSA
ncbi:hypothetical protein [Nonomuraea insulae]|uniref:Uncharacterized protein n=1 Tax=Nonomuraea insulae TaxID=1616787 RepID=A0ABW1CGK8_9ACTN